MSYGGYGGRGGRRGGGRGGRGFGRDGSRERWDRLAGSSGGGHPRNTESESREDRGERGGRGGGPNRPPPHLKGREIGLWYAKWGGLKRKENERKSRAVVQMDESREQHITNLLNTVQRGPTCPGSAREAHPSTSDHWLTLMVMSPLRMS
ncbi:unnamed protein product [Coregonus sp. 'balchen']|nr:unnamed protein product [Coregonus sp. 'balchen']